MEGLIITLLTIILLLVVIKDFYITKTIESMFELYQSLDKRTDILFKYDDLHNKAVTQILNILIGKNETEK